MIFPGTMFAVICKQERSVCYLLRLSKSQSIIQLGDSTQSKQIRKMYFNASFIKSIIISIYSLTISTISSHSFLLVIIFNQWNKKNLQEEFHGNRKLPEKCSWCVEPSASSHSTQICWLIVYSEQRNSSQVLQQQLTSEETPPFLSETICSFKKYPPAQIPQQQDRATCRQCWWLGWPH